jgi:hypothetical protein
MLLALQAAGSRPHFLPETAAEILFILWERRRLHPRLSSTAGKREQDRAWSGSRSVPVNLYYKPRPHIYIQCLGKAVCALIDSGVEKSFISPEFARYIEGKGCRSRMINEIVNLADDTLRPITENFLVAFRTEGRDFRHDFQFMPALGGDMLIGVNLWARLGFWSPPPSAHVKTNALNAAISEGMTPRTPSEEHRLQKFLQNELARFDSVTGPTRKIEHHL